MLRRHLVNRLSHALNTVALSTVIALVLLLWLATAKPSSALQDEPSPDPCAPATAGPAGNLINVRAGPSANYELVGQLSDEDRVPLRARHWQFPWWQIRMNDGSEGWIWNGAIVVYGNVAAVPVVSLPSEGEQEREATWQPSITTVCESPTVTDADNLLTISTPQSTDLVEGLNENDDGWISPINLSRSGLATEPKMFIDNRTNAHALWQEQGADGFLYTREVDGQWLQPAVVELPFGTRRILPNAQAEGPTPLFTPVLLADNAGVIHAFWVGSLGTLQYSNVATEEFDTYASWSQPRTLADTAVGIVAAIDDGNAIHISYINTEETTETPAGVYYLKSENAGENWMEPVPVYASGYMRTATADTAHVQIVATGREGSARVYIAWDNPALEKVFLTRSASGGEDWSGPMVVAERRPGDHNDAPHPNNITLAAHDDQLLVLWQAGHEDEACQQYYQYSDDAGNNWVGDSNVLETFSTCPTHISILVDASGFMYMLAREIDQAYLLAWDGEQWSESQYQDILSTFTNPITFRSASLDCLQAGLPDRRQLILVGCDESGDIWSTERPLSDVEIWFNRGVDWESPQLVSGMNACPNAIEVISGQRDSLHVFWLTEIEDGANAILYSGWEGQRWIPSSVLFLPRTTTIVGFSVVAAPDNQLLIFWLERDGRIYYSQTNPGEEGMVQSADQWATPQQVTTPHERVSTPDVAVDGDGNIYLAYAVPVNEDRGIYLLASTDKGQTWNGPVTIFDGNAETWQVVNQPQLSLSNQGVAQLLWARGQLAGEQEQNVLIEALYFTQIREGGAIFDSPEIIPETEGKVTTWYETATDRKGRLHQFWHESEGDRVLLWHRESEDDGETWSVPTILFNTLGPSTSATTLVRKSDLHLFHLNQDTGALHWTWTEEGIESYPTTSLADLESNCSAAVTVSDTGKLILLYGARTPVALEGRQAAPYSLMAIGRQLEPRERVEAPSLADTLLNPTEAIAPAPSPVASPTPEPSAPIENEEDNGIIGNDFDANLGSEQSPDLGGILLMSLLPVGFLVVVIVVARRGILNRR